MSGRKSICRLPSRCTIKNKNERGPGQINGMHRERECVCMCVCVNEMKNEN